MIPTKPLRAFALVLLAAFAVPARAILTVEITQGVDDPVRIAVVPFSGDAPENVARVIHEDLARSGLFAPLPVEDMLSLPSTRRAVFFQDWRVLGVDHLLIGRVAATEDGRYEIAYELYDVVRGRESGADVRVAPAGDVRRAAHQVADWVFEQVTGLPGAFATRILYVVADDVGTPGARFRLEVADADGRNPRVVHRSPEPLMAATWAPDGRRIAYVSFETGNSAIFLQDLVTGTREQLTDFPGLNSAPAFSPDGRRMTFVLSRDGNPEIYVMDLDTRVLRRITHHYGIDTEPSFTPDGRHLLFTSSRGGEPQIYRYTFANEKLRRLTFAGDYNTRARLLPDGRSLVFVHRADGSDREFHIAVQDLESGRMATLTRTSMDESPTIAPNGAMIMYATQEYGRGILSVVSVDGRVKVRLPASDGDVREPAWSPYLPDAVARSTAAAQ
jgi:TolB protein